MPILGAFVTEFHKMGELFYKAVVQQQSWYVWWLLCLDKNFFMKRRLQTFWEYLANSEMDCYIGLLYRSGLTSPLWKAKAILWISCLQMEKVDYAEQAQRIRKYCRCLLIVPFQNLQNSAFCKAFLCDHDLSLCCCWTVNLQCCPCKSLSVKKHLGKEKKEKIQ